MIHVYPLNHSRKLNACSVTYNTRSPNNNATFVCINLMMNIMCLCPLSLNRFYFRVKGSLRPGVWPRAGCCSNYQWQNPVPFKDLWSFLIRSTSLKTVLMLILVPFQIMLIVELTVPQICALDFVNCTLNFFNLTINRTDRNYLNIYWKQKTRSYLV